MAVMWWVDVVPEARKVGDLYWKSTLESEIPMRKKKPMMRKASPKMECTLELVEGLGGFRFVNFL